MVILLTGGAGFIGSYTTDALLGRGDEVVCIDNFHDLYYDPALKWKRIEPFRQNPAWTLRQGDIRDTEFVEQIFNETRIDKIIHIGAGLWAWGILALFDHWYWGIIPFASFILLNYLFYRRQTFKAMDTERSSPGCAPARPRPVPCP